MSDIDLLVPDALAMRAQDAVISLGFEDNHPAEVSEHAELHGRHLPRLQSTKGRAAVEIHRHIVDPAGPIQFAISDMWDRSRQVDIDGHPTRVLGPEDQLIHLGLNFMHDRRFDANQSLGQLSDIALLAEREGSRIDWALLDSLLRGYAITGFVGCALELSHRLLGAPIPESVRLGSYLANRSTEEVDQHLAQLVRARVFPTAPFAATRLDTVTGAGEFSQAARSLFRRLIPGRRALLERYGERANGLLGKRFYAVRLAGAAATLARQAVRPRSLRENASVDSWIRTLSQQ